jgi:CRP-like cAMP-binding protein
LIRAESSSAGPADDSEGILRICGSGEIVDVFAENGYSHHTCSARAMTHCSVLIWDSKQALAMEILFPQIRTNLKRISANLLERTGRAIS